MIWHLYLSYQIIKHIISKCNLFAHQINNKPDDISIKFEYLAPKEGIVLSVLSKEELKSVPVADGLIKGGGEIKNVNELKSKHFLYGLCMPITIVIIFGAGALIAERIGYESFIPFFVFLAVLGGIGFQFSYFFMAELLPKRREAAISKIFDRGFRETPGN